MEFLQRQKAELEKRLETLLVDNNFIQYERIMQIYLQILKQLDK